ncbi:c-type cytochrome biogenesis protein CcmI [uncultured Cohaesibacter sp.]|uniref:c-type cytochrome biogenesis protein CcmI n=1 Tax=uncultured Cohaesibacter sp. TaxID=1002546 RepID=UPI00292D7493|nr:c-type cytochrome biogenesis protein CcmI [uncultured Cohaesibacter sp.]
MFWTIAVGLTILTIAVAIYPLTRKAKQGESANAYDLTIYKSQLREIEGDVERGLIEAEEAEAARAEVARRLISAQDNLEKEGDEDGKSLSQLSDITLPDDRVGSIKLAVAAVVLIVPIISLGLYFSIGSPSLEGQPLEARLSKPPQEQSLTELVASAERKLKQFPNQVEGWKQLAPIYARMRRTAEAIDAYRNILRLEGETVGTLSDLGEVLVIRDAGVVSSEAYGLFQRANQIDAKAPKPRFFLAIALGQSGDEVEAIKAWQSLVEDSEADAPWISFANNQIAALTKRLEAKVADAEAGQSTEDDGAPEGKKTETGEEVGPTREQVEASSEMSAEERQQMVEGMVANLADRLKTEGGTPDEWVRLIRAELVLNRPDMAAKTVAQAMDALQSDLDGLEKVKAAARSLGVSINQ